MSVKYSKDKEYEYLLPQILKNIQYLDFASVPYKTILRVQLMY